MSNTRLIMIVAVALLLLVFFGRSPMDEVRKKQNEKRGQKLVEKIEDATKKDKAGGLGGLSSQNALTPGTVENYDATPTVSTSRPINGAIQGPMHQYNNGPNPFLNTNPYTRGPNGQYGIPGANNRGGTQQPDDGYYPPPARSNGPQSMLNDPFGLKKLNRNPNFTTDAGHRLGFFGVNVYTFAENGDPIPMPDGKYSMYDGRWAMVVRGGRQTIANGDSGSWLH